MIGRIRAGESGASIVELGVAMFVTALMSASMVAWMQSAGNATALHRVDDDVVQELRMAKELLGRDLRTAEAVLIAGTVSVTLWIDYDDDDFQDAGEAITWSITDEGRLTRSNDLGEVAVHASHLAYGQSQFGYDAPNAVDVTQIGVRLVAEVVLNGGKPGTRSIGIQVHVRNA